MPKKPYKYGRNCGIVRQQIELRGKKQRDKLKLVHDKLKVDGRLYGWDHKLQKRFPLQNKRGKGDRDNALEASNESNASHSPPGVTPSSS
ncbi:hypothetical protein HPB48_011733 [Haemaphysalis longicornis]|uniref:Uncharacterized protein n=1 Tax=Haemaphysalis longicornis TaxID=44386 RepID=A0A9J6F9D4_HAELO|nr:hypothetical protein HPB48_011733 [Haemaphysalis longicornis]